jgi:hypothetical protein
MARISRVECAAHAGHLWGEAALVANGSAVALFVNNLFKVVIDLYAPAQRF